VCFAYISVVSTRYALSVTVKKLDEVLAYMKRQNANT